MESKRDHENETLANKEQELNFEKMIIFAESNFDDLVAYDSACDAGGGEGAGDS